MAYGRVFKEKIFGNSSKRKGKFSSGLEPLSIDFLNFQPPAFNFKLVKPVQPKENAA